jgi:phage FluMu gp28-like protein
MPKLLQGFEEGAIEIPQDANCAADLRCIEEVDGMPMVSKLRRKDLKDPELVRHGDFASMLELGWFASLNMSAPIDFMEAPSHPRGFDNLAYTNAGLRMRFDETTEDLQLPEPQGW